VNPRRDLALEVLALLADGVPRTPTAIASSSKGGIRARRVEVENVLARLEVVGAVVRLREAQGGAKAARRFALAPTYCPARGTNGSSEGPTSRVISPEQFVADLYRGAGS
jgi:hypothetical protein